MAAVPAQADALAHLEDRHVGANRVQHAGDFVAGHARILDAGPDAHFGHRIAVTHAAGLHADAHLSRTRVRKLFLDQLEVSAGGGNLHGTTFH